MASGRTFGINSWWASAWVNLLAAGVSTSTAKATILKSFTTAEQTDVGASMDAVQAHAVTLATVAVYSRYGNADDVFGYTPSSPYQTYAVGT